MEFLRRDLQRLDGRPYPAYKDIRGQFQFDGFELDVVHVQGDPFAAPSRLAVRVPVASLDLPEGEPRNPARRVGIEDALLRAFASALPRGGGSGSGKSGRWGVVKTGQEMLGRTGAELLGDTLTVRFTLGLPARGRRILAREAERLLLKDLPKIVERGVLQAKRSLLLAHADAKEDQVALRDALSERGWVAFVAEGAVLPRRSGIDDRPLGDGAVPWAGPSELAAAVELPNAGTVRGTAIPEGVTLICGGGYHGKSTVLQALARGVYDHIPGDGREYVVTRRAAVQVRAEDGRAVTGVDISGFIANLPDGRSTSRFRTENASGSTSQAAAIVEALELGAGVLLIDEDTSATNFMVRDRRMQELIAADREPITPFLDRVRSLTDDHAVSTVLVVGGSGDYFEVADTVVVMDGYRPSVATERAREIASAHPSGRLAEGRPPLGMPEPRVPLREGFDPSRGRKAERVRAEKRGILAFGEEDVDVSAVAQLVDDGQLQTLGDWMVALSRGGADGRSLRQLCEAAEARAAVDGLSATTAKGFGNRVEARGLELGAAVNRLRSLELR